MNIILDTDTIIYFLKGEHSVIKKMLQVDSKLIHTTMISHSELFYGAYHSKHMKKNLEKISVFLDTISVLPYTKEASQIFGKLKASLKKKGKLIADMDLTIASICLENNAELITNNTRHFERIPKLKYRSWL